MPLDKAQFVAPPSTVGSTPDGYQTGGVKQGNNISISNDGTISAFGGSSSGVARIIAGTNVNISSTGPSGTGDVTINASGGGGGGDVTRIIAGTNVSISSTGPSGTGDVTINASGGGGDVTRIDVSSPITGGGTGTPNIGFDNNTESLTRYLKLSGGSLTGSLSMGNNTNAYIEIGNGNADNPSLRFTQDRRTGFGSIAGGHTFSTIINSVERQRWDDGGQAIFSNPSYAGLNSPFRAGIQIWGSDSDSVGGSLTGVYATNSSQTGAFFVARRCRGTNPVSPQGVQTDDWLGGVVMAGSKGNWDEGSTKNCQVRGQMGNQDSDSAQLIFAVTQQGQGIADRCKIGPKGSFVPINNNDIDLGGPSAKWSRLFLQNAPIVGAVQGEDVTLLDEGFGLSFLNSLELYSYVPDNEEWVAGPTQVTSDGTPYQGVVSHIVTPGTQIFWGLSEVQLGAALSQTGVQGNFGLIESEGDSAGIRYEQLVMPLILSIQQLSSLNDSLQSQIDSLQTAFENYVAAHP